MHSEDMAGDQVELIRSEYLQLPGLSLTKVQAQRLWGLDAPTCERLFEALVGERFLRKTSQRGRYVRPEFKS